MHSDARGLPLSTASPAAAAAFDHLVTGYLTYRADTPARLPPVLEADPDFALAHCMQGYLAMLAFKQAVVPIAVQAARTAQSLADAVTPRERNHIAALTAWADGDLDRAIAAWESILRAHPHDLVAFRLAHFVNFWLGRPQDMVASVERVIPTWSEDVPGYSVILACRCFAHEEAGNCLAAEPSGRRAIELDPGDLWAAHAVAHVMETQGRRSEGIQWLTTLAPNWEGSHNLQHHLWWHFANGRGTVPPIVRDCALPIAEAQLARAAGRHAEALALLRPAIGGMYRLGGSHTQQDVLEQLFLDAALKAESTADIRLAVERVAGRRAIPPERFIGWREAAQRVSVM